MKTAVLAFTKAGAKLAEGVAKELGGEAFAPQSHAGGDVAALSEPIAEWIRQRFGDYDAFVFISACGIAVRAIAACVTDKLTDPAVVVMDERGLHVISLLSGHAGGANELAQRLALLTGGEAVITTATDINGAPAVDVWAKKHDCAIENRAAVKSVSGAVLEGIKVGVAVTDETIAAPFPVTLFLRPRDLVLGVGCKRGTAIGDLESAVEDFMRGAGFSPLSLYAIASIDIKRSEEALIEFSKRRLLDFACYSAGELSAVPGNFSASERVYRETGVDNVCERACVLCSGGVLLRGKTAYEGITLALSRRARDVC